VAEAKENGVKGIDLVVVNLYPFESVVRQDPGDYARCVENIDIGGPSMLRSAAKNFEDVVVCSSPAQYPVLLDELKRNGGKTSRALRRGFAAKAFAHTAAFDAAVAQWFGESAGGDSSKEGGAEEKEELPDMPENLVISAARKQALRYGENPHQRAAFYVRRDCEEVGVATATVIQGKELSYNNIADTDAAFRLVSEFVNPATVIVKHGNPCGAAFDKNGLGDSYCKALACDPVSAFGGIVAFNRTLDKTVAEFLSERFYEVIIAPDISVEAEEILAKKKNLRVLLTGAMPADEEDGPRSKADDIEIKAVTGGFLVQDKDRGSGKSLRPSRDFQVVTKRAPTDDEMLQLLFAWKVCKHVKSNAIVYARDNATVGIGAGQMSRVDSARIASRKAAEAAEAAGEEQPRTIGAVVASDAFFPFADGLEACAEAGATAVVQPGGSKRDEEVIAAADARGIAMVFTGMRHFRH